MARLTAEQWEQARAEFSALKRRITLLHRALLRYGKNSKQFFPGSATAKTSFRLAPRRLSRRTGLTADIY